MRSKPPVIAIDGPSASGKGTVARRLAIYFDYAHLDTGLLYRAVGLLAAERNISMDDEAKLANFAGADLMLEMVINKMDMPNVRSEEASKMASKVAAIPSVRAVLLKFQQDFCAVPPHGKKGAVLDGRDIGTVIAPTAAVKIFVTADVETRAERRYQELHARDVKITPGAILDDLQERDARDATRSISPSKPAPDAVILNTTQMTADEAFEAALKIAESVLGPPASMAQG